MVDANPKPKAVVDPVWSSMLTDAAQWAEQESALASWMHASVMDQRTFEDALAYLISQKLGGTEMSDLSVYQVVHNAMLSDATIGESARADLSATYDRDPACTSYLEPFLYFKGFHALQAYRIGHWLWGHDRTFLAKYFQSRINSVFGVDIHPAARIGKGIMVDHGTGVVIGETAIVEDGVSLLHGVTLGGTGKETGDRHPKIRRGTMIGAGATVLGNIEVGECSRVGAGSVVLKSVDKNTTVAGVPAKVVGSAGCAQPALSMDQQFYAEEYD
ncbi:serine O-acetyltransferase [Nisaea denitrificans]|uniref:serine O-acetyltransferase n=1 Tax=Nisaea denitrificans TaxID=390877 RepID=UPI000424482C|nr:serine O-acetyltransferase [Nisaea denitrificans]